ncbi:glycine cleavage H-protein-domain-containing protein [Delphinella strobiligena]|nr:glycine cleavage H-protein-domain-containing protein [Delphinella strobiligena]
MAAALANTLFRRSVHSAARAASLARASFVPTCVKKSLVARPFSSTILPQIKKYTEDHEWIDVSEDGQVGTIGVSDYAAHALGDVVFVELPTIDLEVAAGDSIGAVESVKSASDIMTPVSGIILETNSVLEDKPSNINRDPEGEGWLAKIKISDKIELDGLMDAAAYKAFTEESAE